MVLGQATVDALGCDISRLLLVNSVWRRGCERVLCRLSGFKMWRHWFLICLQESLDLCQHTVTSNISCRRASTVPATRTTVFFFTCLHSATDATMSGKNSRSNTSDTTCTSLPYIGISAELTTIHPGTCQYQSTSVFLMFRLHTPIRTERWRDVNKNLEKTVMYDLWLRTHRQRARQPTIYRSYTLTVRLWMVPDCVPRNMNGWCRSGAVLATI